MGTRTIEFCDVCSTETKIIHYSIVVREGRASNIIVFDESRDLCEVCFNALYSGLSNKLRCLIE